MTSESVCPFYGRNTEFCDVGCGLVTAREAGLIIRHCATSFGDCPRYVDVVARQAAAATRASEGSIIARMTGARRRKSPGDEHPQHAHFNSIAGKDKTMNAQAKKKEVPPTPSLLDEEALSPVGLLGFGMTVLLLNLHYSGLFPFNPLIFGMGIFYGGLGQVIIGFMEWRKGSLFGATVFVAFGLFWLSLLALLVFPEGGWGKPPQAAAMAAYFAMWGLFSTIIFFGAVRIGRAMQVLFGTLAVALFLFSAADFAGVSAIRTVAGIVGMGCGISAFYLGINRSIQEVRSRKVVPMGANAK